MRLASRDVCDDETWENTWANRSEISVAEQLARLHLEQAQEESSRTVRTKLPEPPEKALHRRSEVRGRVMFHEEVVVFTPEIKEYQMPLDDSDNESV